MEAVQIDGGKDVGQLWNDNVELGQQFNFAASDCRIDVQLPRHGDEVFLENLQGYDAGACAPVLCHQIERTPLLCRCGPVVRINQDISVEEATSAHEFRFG